MVGRVSAEAGGTARFQRSDQPRRWLIDLNGSRVMLPVAAPVTSVLVLKGFVRERGRAIAYVELGMPVAAMIFVPLTQMFIDWWGWETTWIVLSAIGLGVIVPLTAILVRRHPEDIGLPPEGDYLHRSPNGEAVQRGAEVGNSVSADVGIADSRLASWAIASVKTVENPPTIIGIAVHSEVPVQFVTAACCQIHCCFNTAIQRLRDAVRSSSHLRASGLRWVDVAGAHLRLRICRRFRKARARKVGISLHYLKWVMAVTPIPQWLSAE